MPWKPGETGNPGGRAKTKLFQQALRNVLTLREAEKMARALVRKAVGGDLGAINMCADRLDGKPNQSVEIADERTDDLAERFEQILASTAPDTEKAPDEHAKKRSGKATRK